MRPSATDVALFFRTLAALQGAGVHIVRGLEVTAQQAAHPELAEAVRQTLQEVNSGQRLSRSLQRHPRLFSPLQVQMLAVGERTGSLHLVLERLAGFAEKASGVRQKVRSALTYPALVMLLCLAMLVMLPSLVFRDLLTFLEGLHVELPMVTRLLLALSSPWCLVLAPLLLAAVGALLWRVPRQRWERVLLALPCIGPALQAGWVADFCRALALGYGSGVPLLASLEMAGRGGSQLMEKAIHQVRRQVEQGEPLARALGYTELFPPMALHLIQAGEESGRLAAMLERVSLACEEMVDERLHLATAMLQPLVLLMVGTVVGFMVIATMAPMLKVVESL